MDKVKLVVFNTEEFYANETVSRQVQHTGQTIREFKDYLLVFDLEENRNRTVSKTSVIETVEEDKQIPKTRLLSGDASNEK